jgi:hypothetical protein
MVLTVTLTQTRQMMMGASVRLGVIPMKIEPGLRSLAVS